MFTGAAINRALSMGRAGLTSAWKSPTLSWNNLALRGSLIGAGVGGIGGALSDQGSFWGGAMKGAALGAGAGYLYPSAMRGASAFAFGTGGLAQRMKFAARVAGRDLQARGRVSAARIGATAGRAYTRIRGLMRPGFIG